MTSIENSYQKVYLQGNDSENENIIHGYLDSGLEVAVIGRCSENAKELIAFFHNNVIFHGKACGKFISSNAPPDFESLSSREVLLYALLDKEITFEGEFPTGDDFKNYFSHTNANFLYLNREKEKDFILSREIFYSKEKWNIQSFRFSGKRLEYRFRRLRDNHSRLIFLDDDEKCIDFFNNTTDSIPLVKIKMERIDRV